MHRLTAANATILKLKTQLQQQTEVLDESSFSVRRSDAHQQRLLQLAHSRIQALTEEVGAERHLAHATVQPLQEEVDVLKVALDTEGARSKGLQTTVDSMRNDVVSMELTIAMLRTTLMSAKKDMRELHAATRTTASMLSSKVAQLAGSEARSPPHGAGAPASARPVSPALSQDAVAADVHRLRSGVSALCTAAESLASVATATSATNAELKAELNRALTNRAVVAAEAAAAAARRQSDSLRQEAATAIETLQRDLQVATAKLERAQASSTALQRRVSGLETAQAARDAELVQLKVNLDDARRSFAVAREDKRALAVQVAEHKAVADRVRAVEVKFAEAHRAKNHEARAREVAVAECVSVRHKLSESTATVKHLKQQLRSARGRNKALQHQLDDKQVGSGPGSVAKAKALAQAVHSSGPSPAEAALQAQLDTAQRDLRAGRYELEQKAAELKVSMWGFSVFVVGCCAVSSPCDCVCVCVWLCV